MPALGPGNKPVHVKTKKKPKYKLPSTHTSDSAQSGSGKPKASRGPSARSHSQPGIITDREDEIIEKRKGKAKYRVAVRAGRTHGGQSRRGTSPAPDSHDVDRGREASDENIREARIRYVRRVRPTGVDLLERELEGEGVLAKVLDRASERGAPLAASVIQRNLPGVRGVKRVDASAKELVTRAAKDLITFPAQAIPSLYVPAAGLVEAAQGDPSRLRQLGKDIDEGDPVYNLAAAAIEAAGGDEQAAQERLRRARDAAIEHPGLTAVEALGVKGAVGRAGGSLARSPVSPRRVRQVASKSREKRFLEGTDLVESREYSPDIITKAGQVAVERISGAGKKPIPDREIRRRVDENVGVTDEVTRNRVARDLDDENIGVDRVLREFGVERVDDLPDVARARLAEHERSRTSGSRVFRLANRQFRETVLSTSPKWVAGNLIEGLGRAALNRAGPVSYARGRKVVKRLGEITPDKAEEATARMIGGGHLSTARRTRAQLPDDYFAGTNIAPIANKLSAFWRKPGPKQAAGIWHAWTELTMRQISGRAEVAFQTAHLGRELRRAGEKSIEQAAQGLTKTEEQVRFGRLVDRAYGRYAKLSPGERWWISNMTPFVRWFLNSADFVYRTLPRDHPVVTAMIASAEQATEEWRKTEGLDKWIKDALPGWLQGSIPTGGGAHQRASQFTPFGAFSDPGGTAAGQLTPLLTSVASALSGEKWTGDPLYVKGEDGKKREANDLERVVFAAHEFLKATVPFLSPTERVAEKGPRALDPFKDVSPPKKKLKTAKPRKLEWSDQTEWSDEGEGFFGTKPAEGEGFFDR